MCVGVWPTKWPVCAYIYNDLLPPIRFIRRFSFCSAIFVTLQNFLTFQNYPPTTCSHHSLSLFLPPLHSHHSQIRRPLPLPVAGSAGHWICCWLEHNSAWSLSCCGAQFCRESSGRAAAKRRRQQQFGSGKKKGGREGLEEEKHQVSSKIGAAAEILQNNSRKQSFSNEAGETAAESLR